MVGLRLGLLIAVEGTEEWGDKYPPCPCDDEEGRDEVEFGLLNGFKCCDSGEWSNALRSDT